LVADEQELFERMTKRYEERRSGALRYTAETIRLDRHVIADFHSVAGVPPWRASQQHFEAWCKYLMAERQIKPASQRRYQGSLAGFYDYLSRNVAFQNEVQRRFGTRIEQIAPPESRIPHVVENEGEGERPALSLEQIDQFFAAIDAVILEAQRFRGKDLQPARRDKAYFYTMYACGLRIGEANGIKIEHFVEEPKLPDLGRYGAVHVWGKGSKGSGPRHRLVPITTPHLPPMLAWYETEVRPYLFKPGKENENAFFLSERGTPLTRGGMEYRFHKYIARAGLEGRGLVPHSLRHSSVTHEADRMSLAMNQRKHGHTLAATTQGYMHHSDEYLRERYTEMVSEQLDRALQKSEKPSS